MEQGLDRLLGARERRGVRAGGAGAGAGGPALHGEDRLLAGHPTRDPAEPPRVAERLEVERDEAGLGILLPVLEEVVGRDVGLVADRDERREAETALGCLLEEGEAERSALGGEANRAGRQRAGAERRVQRWGCNRDPEAIGPDEPPTVRADGCEEPLLSLAALVSDLGEACRDHAEGADSRAEGGLGGIDDVRRRQADDGEVDGLGELVDRGVGAHSCDRLAASVHGIRRALVVAGEDVPEQDPADRLAPRRCADDRDACRCEERTKRRHDSQVVALVDVAEIRLGGLDRECDFEGAAVELARDAEAGVLEDPEHRRVVRHHLGDEPLDAGCGRALRQLLEHARADPTTLVLVGHSKRDLRSGRVAEPRIACERDDALGAVVRQRPDERASLDPVRVEVGLDEGRPHGRRAVEAEVEAALGEAAEELGQGLGVGGLRRPEPQRAAVSQDDVDRSGSVGREGGPGARRAPGPGGVRQLRQGLQKYPLRTAVLVARSGRP